MKTSRIHWKTPSYFSGLPLLVKQKYGSELRNKSLASLKPEISQALASLLEELRSIEDTKAMRIGSFNPRRNPSNGQGQARRRPFLSCILCKTAGRPHNTHDLIDCRFLPERDKRPWVCSRLVTDHPELNPLKRLMTSLFKLSVLMSLLPCESALFSHPF